MTITAIIPALNEEISIGSMVIKTKKYANHVIVVDDGSIDNTAEIARFAGADVISHTENMGKGYALKTGFNLAKQNGTKVIVTIDADGQHDPEDIPKMVSPILTNDADMVIGRYNEIDDSSGFRAFAAHKVSYFRFEQNGFYIEDEMLTDAINAGFKIKEIDIIARSNIHHKKQRVLIKNGAKIIAALPAHNEENYIAKVILCCRELVDEVVVVDDGSNDATSDIANALGAIVVRHDKNKGYGAAIKTCFKVAKERNADIMVILDSDGQHDPRDIIKLVEHTYGGTDIVIGSRFMPNNGNSVPTYRKIGMKILDLATIRAGCEKVSDSQSGFRAYSKKAIEQIHIEGNGMSVGSEILLQAKEQDLKISEVPIICRYDQGESSQNPISHGLNVLFGIFGRTVYKKPLLFSLAGMLFLIFGGIIGIWSFESYIRTGNLPFGPTMILLLFIILGSLSIFSGLILHSMRNIVKEIKNEL